MAQSNAKEVRILGVPEKFFWETVRSIIFGVTAILATYLIFKPIEAERALNTEKRRLEIDYERKEQTLALEYSSFVQEKVFEQRMEVIDNFMLKSDAYTKTAFNVFQNEDPISIEKYQEGAYNEYQLALARLRAAFGPELAEAINSSRLASSALHDLFKEMVQDKTKTKAPNKWRSARKALVEANISITDTAIAIMYRNNR